MITKLLPIGTRVRFNPEVCPNHPKNNFYVISYAHENDEWNHTYVLSMAKTDIGFTYREMVYRVGHESDVWQVAHNFQIEVITPSMERDVKTLQEELLLLTVENKQLKKEIKELKKVKK